MGYGKALSGMTRPEGSIDRNPQRDITVHNLFIKNGMITSFEGSAPLVQQELIHGPPPEVRAHARACASARAPTRLGSGSGLTTSPVLAITSYGHN